MSNLTEKDLVQQQRLEENLDHFADGIQKACKHFYECLVNKLKTVNSSLNTREVFDDMLKVSEDISETCLWLKEEKSSLDVFQEKVACLLEAILKLLVLWDQEIVIGLRKLINCLRNTLLQMRKANTAQELVIYYKVIISPS